RPRVEEASLQHDVLLSAECLEHGVVQLHLVDKVLEVGDRVAVGSGRLLLEDELVLAEAAGQGVLAATAKQDVVAGAAIQLVVAETAVETVVAGEAADRVVATLRIDLVVAGIAGDRVGQVVAGAVDVAGAGQLEVFERALTLADEAEGDGRPNGVDAAAEVED